ncbi:hypothetical protein [Desulfobacter latus]|uniref:GGDEF domain-containing protein n=1 Tax=Desulfobacter latus TaxID=2292 RepID=A0A850STK8_9BACT|nr:hypothetical protein [Desulfobacter latus]NWH04704.1 hypothetical protein [Desulfobacter latus]
MKTFQRYGFCLFSFAGYLVLKPLLGYEVFGESLPLTGTEILSLVFTCQLSQKISANFNEFEETIENLTFQQIGMSPKLYDSEDTEDMYREVKRCRRFQHPLSLIKVRPKVDPGQYQPTELLKEMQRAFVDRYAQAKVAKLFSDELRDTDLIVIKNNELIVLLPETSEKDAYAVLDSLTKKAHVNLKINLDFGLSSFPDHSVTLNGLLDLASADLEKKMPETNSELFFQS